MSPIFIYGLLNDVSSRLVLRVSHSYVCLLVIVNTQDYPHDQNLVTSNSVIECEVFMTELNKTFSDRQLCQVIEWSVNQHFENHPCSHHQGTDNSVIYAGIY